jgi:antitoxin (DNA-binding transcriptional repressor) of toxin-antitoxin stability system
MPSYPLSIAREELSRLIDQAQGGQVVTITRDGKPVAELRALEVAPKRRSSAHLIDDIAARAKLRPWVGKSAVDLLREMRDEESRDFMRRFSRSC